MANKALATTFMDGLTVQVEVLSAPSATGLCKVDFNGRTLARHVDRLAPVTEEAKRLIGR